MRSAKRITPNGGKLMVTLGEGAMLLILNRCLAIMRGPNTSEWANYQNATRSGPIELRFRGKDRLARLQRLKKEWDPTRVFTTQLLE